MTTMQNQMVEVEIPTDESKRDKLATLVLNRFNTSIIYRQSIRCGDVSLQQTLLNCYQQKHGIYSDRDKDIIQQLESSNLYVNLTDLKSNVLESQLRNILLNSTDLPFTISPTNIPDLSNDMKMVAVAAIRKEFLEINPEDKDGLYEITKRIKAEYLSKQKEIAKTASNAMYDEIKKQCINGGYFTSMGNFLRDFSIYPYAVLHGPVPTMRTHYKWVGDSVKESTVVENKLVAISPFDLVWTADSTNTQNGTGIFLRERISIHALTSAKTMKSYIAGNIDKIIERNIKGDQRSLWLTEHPDVKGQNSYGESGFVEVLRHYGTFKGSDLQDAGVTGLEKEKYYEACVSVVGCLTIQVFLIPYGGVYTRPVHTATYEATGDHIQGISVAQKIRDVERAYLAILRATVDNAIGASKPIVEADIGFLQKFFSDNSEAWSRIVPGSVIPVERGGRNGTAYNFHEIPNNAASYANLMQVFSDLADRITNLPAALHGEPVGTGANRTFRGMSLLNSNTLKPIQMGIQNLDNSVHKPLGTLLYDLNLKYSKNNSIKGDCDVWANGSTGLLQKEIERQKALEILELVLSTGAATQPGLLPPKLLPWALMSVLKASDVPEDILEYPDANSQQGQQSQQGAEMMQGAVAPQQQNNIGV